MATPAGKAPIGDPFFWGEGASRFATFHTASGTGRGAVVLLYPLGHEYVRAHRAFRNLALALSSAGLAVLRFDYTGTGDSSGESADIRVATLLEDVEAAIAECMRRSRRQRVSLVGLRLGASLAVMAAARRDDIDTVVAWDPVVGGNLYIDELKQLQTGWLRDRLGAANIDIASDEELLGLRVPPELMEDLRGVDLAGAAPRAARIQVIESRPRADTAAWVAQLQQRGTAVTCEHTQSAGDWDNPEAVHQLLLPHEIVRRIVTLMTR